MGYVRSTLMPGEHIVTSSRLHWIIFFWPLVWLGISVGVLGYGLALGGGGAIGTVIRDAQQASEPGKQLDDRLKAAVVVTVLGGLLVGATVLCLMGRMLRRWTSEFAVTNKRVVLKVGVLRTLSVEVLLSRVESITIRQGILGWILGYGSIAVKGIGGTVDPFPCVADPLELRRAVQQHAWGDDL